MIIPKPLPAHGNRAWSVTTEPTTEPITVAELKTFARIDGTDEDTYLTSLITAIRQASENYLGRALISQTITLSMDWWPGESIELPRPPLISVTSIGTLDEDDTETTYSSDNYYLDTRSEPGLIVVKSGSSLPAFVTRRHGAYKIVYVAGYGILATDVPQPIREAIKFWCTWIYENRVPITDPPDTAMLTLNPYRMPRI